MDTKLSDFWDNKHPKQDIIYSGRSLPTSCPTCHQRTMSQNIPLDVRKLVNSDDAVLKKIIKENNLIGSSDDQTILLVQQWVVKNLRYVGDDKNEGVMEFWQFPFETVASKIGDCEDGAILIASLVLNAGVPSHKIRITAGMVQPAPTAPTGGHGYVTFLREADENWIVIDWCFYEDSKIEVKDKKIFKENTLYKEIWFSFNDKYSWAHKEYEVSGRLKARQ